jgi:hypothetical protein
MLRTIRERLESLVSPNSRTMKTTRDETRRDETRPTHAHGDVVLQETWRACKARNECWSTRQRHTVTPAPADPTLHTLLLHCTTPPPHPSTLCGTKLHPIKSRTSPRPLRPIRPDETRSMGTGPNTRRKKQRHMATNDAPDRDRMVNAMPLDVAALLRLQTEALSTRL